MSARAAVTLLLLAVGTEGCRLGPDYERPEIPTPAAWREIPAAEAESLANIPWWELFQDPALQELLRIALAENKDLQIAIARIDEARASYGFAKSEFWPQVDLEASAARIRSSRDALAPIPSGVDSESELYNLGATVFWELDFFGRIRRTTEAELALLLATEEAHRAVVLTLVSGVARAWVELRDFDWRLEISRRTLESRREYVQLATDRFQGGLTPEIDLRQAEAELYRTESLVHDFERLVVLKENEIAVLLGRNPEAVLRGRPLEEEPPIPAVPAGLPSDLLERRPDLREAEEVLHAATADIGRAKALLFPRISLTGGYGWEASDFDELLRGETKSWSIAGNLLQPIFQGGRNIRRVEIAEAEQRQALYEYELAVLQAFRDVEDALIDWRKRGEQRVSQRQRVSAERKVLELAELRYRGGVATYLEVLDAQRSLFSAELDEVETIGNHLVALIRLYKALGGGWPAYDEPAPPPE